MLEQLNWQVIDFPEVDIFKRRKYKTGVDSSCRNTTKTSSFMPLCIQWNK